MSDADALAIAGLHLAARGEVALAPFLRGVADVAPARLVALAAIAARPRGLSVIVPAPGGVWSAALLASLAAQVAAGQVGAGVEVILAGPPGVPAPSGLPAGLRHVAAHAPGQGAACAAAVAVAQFSHLALVAPQTRVASGLAAGLLAACDAAALVLARPGDDDMAPGAVPQAIRAAFRTRGSVDAARAEALAPALLSPLARAFPAIFAALVAFPETKGDDIAAFTAAVIARLMPDLRLAGPAARDCGAPPGEAEPARQVALAAAIDQIVAETPHPLALALRDALGTMLRAALADRPALLPSALSAAEVMRPALRDAVFRDLCLTGPAAGPVPRVSIVMPVHNTAAVLLRCLDSLAAQTMPDYELLAVDDASTDDSLALLLDRAAQDPRLRVFRHAARRGPGGARNTAMRAARAPYIGFVDSDDHVAPGFLAGLLEGTEDGHFDIVVCGIMRCTPDGTPTGQIETRPQRIDPVPDGTDLLSLLTPALWNKLWRASLFGDRAHVFAEDMFFQDSARSPSVLARARRINRIGTPLYTYVMGDANITARHSDKHLVDYMRLFDLVATDMAAMGRLIGREEDYVAWVGRNIDYHLRSAAGVTTATYARHARLIGMAWRSDPGRQPLVDRDDILMRHVGML